MNKISILYDGVDLADYMDGVTGIKRDIGSGWSNTTQAIPDGVDFLFNTRSSKQIVIDFFIKGSISKIAQVREKLAILINKEQPAPLILGDEPNKIWYAVPDDKQELSNEPDNPKGTLTFLVPSGVSVSSFEKLLTSTTKDDNIGSITPQADGTVDILINNQGTLPAFPKFKFTHKSDNASISLVGENGVYSVGSQEQHLKNSVTTETRKVESQFLLNPSAISQKNNFDGHFMNANDEPNPQNGQLLTAGNLVWKQDGLRLQDGGPPPAKDVVHSARGGMQKFTIPADSTGNVGAVDFTSTFNIWGQATRMGQTGMLQVLFVDGNNKLMAGMGIYKDDTKGNSFQTQLYIGGNHPGTWKTFGPGLQELNNGGHGDGRVANPNLYFNSTTGYFTIQKKGPVFNFTFGNRGGNYQKVISELSAVKCAKVLVYIGQLKGRDDLTQLITNLSLRSLNFQKNDVVKTIDTTTDATKYIPADNHHFGNHEVVVLDMSSGNTYRREGSTIANDEVIKGSEPFSVPPGKSIVTAVFGDGATIPDIEVTIKERYL